MATEDEVVGAAEVYLARRSRRVLPVGHNYRQHGQERQRLLLVAWDSMYRVVEAELLRIQFDATQADLSPGEVGWHRCS